MRGSVPPRFLQFARALFVAASGLDRGPAQPTMRIFCPCEMRYREIPGFACRDHYFWIDSALSVAPSKARDG
jgi:hypothetical protein